MSPAMVQKKPQNLDCVHWIVCITNITQVLAEVVINRHACKAADEGSMQAAAV
jgi:hypothetical protein